MSRTNHLLRNPLWSAIDVDLKGLLTPGVVW